MIHLAEEQLKYAKTPKIMKQYASVYVIMFLILIASYSIVIIIYFFLDKPKTGHQQILFSAVYPFEIESLLLKILLYFNHIIGLVHSSIVINFDGITVFLIYICTHRLKVLEYHFKNATNFIRLTYCIRKHNNILR